MTDMSGVQTLDPPTADLSGGSVSSTAKGTSPGHSGAVVHARRASMTERYGGLWLLIAMLIVFTIALPGEFATKDNFVGVLSNETTIGLMSLALLLPLAAGVFDLSIAGTMTLSVVLVTWLFQTTGGAIAIPVAILIALLAGAIAGGVNGILVLKGRVDPFIATIATSAIMVGISQAIANGTTITNSIPTAFTDLGRSTVAGVPVQVIYGLVVMAVLWYVMEYTPFGRATYATGAGREAARLAGVRTNRVIFIAFAACATLAAVAGVTYAARLGAGPPDTGASFLLSAYTVAFLGSTMMRPGRFNVPGLVVALSIVAFGINGLQLWGLPFWVVQLYQGLVLITAVLLARRRTR
jgi:ribose transport system permease protein